MAKININDNSVQGGTQKERILDYLMEWQEESNYLARVLLLYIEKISPSTKAQSELYDWLKQREGGLGILGEDELKRFYIQ